MHRSANFVGTWISAYFNDGIDSLSDKRGGDHRSFLNEMQISTPRVFPPFGQGKEFGDT